jgi:2-polyprenyl-3-methyl-5-hydroxy-6-metoxy-1,4-benzoquinol methylase
MPKVAQFLPDAATLASDQGVDLEICQCSGCGLVQLLNEPVSYYRDVIRAAAYSPEMKAFRLAQFKDFLDKYQLAGKKVLEVGCGCGEYLTLMQESGAAAYGLEHLAESVAKCQAIGLNVSQGFIASSDYQLKDAPFDAFFILNFFEHLPDPNSLLRGIYHNLAEGAVGLIEVPNFDMIVEKKLFSEFMTDHLLYFTKETLNNTLKLNGFDILASDVVWHDYIISTVVSKRPKLDLTHFYQDQEKIKKEILDFVSKFSIRKIAIWGAGHQALAIMSLADLTGKIRYVIDSALFKQDKFTPATHIPIVSPKKLISDPVDAVIIMCASYSDEVVKIIQAKYGSNIKIAVLRDFGLEMV